LAPARLIGNIISWAHGTAHALFLLEPPFAQVTLDIMITFAAYDTLRNALSYF